MANPNGVHRNKRSPLLWTPTSFLLFMWFCSLAPPRQTQSPWGFSCDPLPGVCLGPWALAHGYGPDSVPWVGAARSSLSLCSSRGSPLCPPIPQPRRHPHQEHPTLQGTVHPTPQAELGVSPHPGTHGGFSLGRSPPPAPRSTEATSALTPPRPGPQPGGSIAHSLLARCCSLT